MKGFVTMLCAVVLYFGCNTGRQELGELGCGVSVVLEQNDEGDWGISLVQDGETFVDALYSLHVELFEDENIVTLNQGFDVYSIENDELHTYGSIAHEGAVFHFTDTWKIVDSVIQLNRQVKVTGNSKGGFMSGIQFRYSEPLSRDSVDIFAPGNIYGATSHLSPGAIGGSNCKDFIRIREDRLSAPLFGAYFADGYSFTFLNSQPDAQTTKEDSYDNVGNILIDERFRFGAIGADFVENHPIFGYWFPGSEGGVTYKGRNKLRKWSRRYHPIKAGLQQEYQVSFRIDTDPVFTDYYPKIWKWAWNVLNPRLNPQDIELSKKYLIKRLGENVETHGSITGIKKFIPFPLGVKSPVPPRTVMGFTGKSLEVASYLLFDSKVENNPLAQKHLHYGESIINTFLNLELAPPAGEGFYFTGEPALTRPLRTLPEPILFLRSFGDGLKELLKAAKREQIAGRYRKDWVNWTKTFADWLLPQQTSEGGFARSWKQGTGEVFDPSTETTYTVISFLVLLSELTGEEAYAKAAVKAGEFCWSVYHKQGAFVGATLDNPNVMDKEAGTISLEAYLMLYKMTNETKWLNRAEAAANFAETWMYIWNVPMVEGNDDIYWDKGLSTVGLQLITTGHSLTDMYMAFDVDEFAELYLHTGDRHYYDVARILLHNTKAMVALPGREYDLPGPGWVQETWSLAPTRGKGILKAWLPWVSTSQLNGIIELQELDAELYNKMIHP